METLMKKSVQVVLSFLVLCIFSTYANAKPPVLVKIAKGEAKVTMLEGTANAVCPGQKGVKKLIINDLLKSGCEVSTGDKSRMELFLPDNSIVRFADNTSFKIMQVDAGQSGKRDVKIFVTIGKIWSNVRKALGGMRKESGRIGLARLIYGRRGLVIPVLLPLLPKKIKKPLSPDLLSP